MWMQGFMFAWVEEKESSMSKNKTRTMVVEENIPQLAVVKIEHSL